MSDGHVAISQRVFLHDDSHRFVSAVDNGLESAVPAIAHEIAAMARILAPKRTLELMNSIEAVVASATSAIAIATAPHAAAQELGAGPHVIEPLNADGTGSPYGVLANPEEDFFSTHAVMHPGNPPVGYLRGAGEIVDAAVPDIMAEHLP